MDERPRNSSFEVKDGFSGSGEIIFLRLISGLFQSLRESHLGIKDWQHALKNDLNSFV